MNIFKGFFNILSDFLMQSHKKLGIILLNKIYQEFFKLKFSVIKVFSKGLIYLAMRGPQELQETAHMKSYRVDTLPKHTEYIFQYENDSFLLIKCCLEKS